MKMCHNTTRSLLMKKMLPPQDFEPSEHVPLQDVESEEDSLDEEGFSTTLFLCHDKVTPMDFILSLKCIEEENLQRLMNLMIHCGAKVSCDLNDASDYSAIIVDHEDVLNCSMPVFSYKFLEDCLRNHKLQEISHYRLPRSRCMDVVYHRTLRWNDLTKRECTSSVNRSEAVYSSSDGAHKESPLGQIDDTSNLKQKDGMQEENSESTCSLRTQVAPNIAALDLETASSETSQTNSQLEENKVTEMNFPKASCRKNWIFPEGFDSDSDSDGVLSKKSSNTVSSNESNSNESKSDGEEEPSPTKMGKKARLRNVVYSQDSDSDGNEEPSPSKAQQPSSSKAQARKKFKIVMSSDGEEDPPPTKFGRKTTLRNVMPSDGDEDPPPTKFGRKTTLRNVVYSQESDSHVDEEPSPSKPQEPSPSKAQAPSKAQDTKKSINSMSSDGEKDLSQRKTILRKKNAVYSQVDSDRNEEPSPSKAQEKTQATKQLKKGSKKLYIREEQANILKYIVSHNEYSRIMGRELWMIMERRKVCPNRSWQSMKEHFIKKIVPHLDDFDCISKEEKRKLKHK